MREATTLTNSEPKELTRRANSRTGRAEDSRRARLILLLAEGHTWDEVSERIDCSRGFVASWSRRFTEQLPLKYFGANAAGLRLAVISYNVLTAL